MSQVNALFKLIGNDCMSDRKRGAEITGLSSAIGAKDFTYK